LLPEWAIWRVADFAPALAAVKLTEIVVDTPGASVTLAASSKVSANCAASVPVMVVWSMTMLGSPVPPRLVSWSDLELVAPTVTVPKSRLVGEAASWLGPPVETISMPLMAGFCTTCPKVMSRLASLETVNDLTTPL
jgi:hypothetical protein